MSPLVVLSIMAVTFSSSINAQTISLGKCPDVSVKTDFDLSRYAGTWYETTKNRRYWIIMDSGLKCTSETYTLVGNNTIHLLNKGNRILNNREVTTKGVGRLVSPGKLAFTFQDLSFSPRDVPYWVLDTDYTNYAVVWSCSDRAGMNAQVSWILSREPQPEPSIVRKATDVLTKFGLGRSSMVPTLHKNCRDALHKSEKENEEKKV